jgi:putative membrane protein
MMSWYGDGPGWGGWLVMTLMMVLFWAQLLFGGTAIARGEIGAEDDRSRRDLLRAGH